MRTAARIATTMVPGQGGARASARVLPEEVPVAVTVNGTTQAVMMCTPADLEDFAVGFALSEGLARPGEIEELEIVALPAGMEARLWLPERLAEALGARRRAMLGPVGCGLCGIESLEQALRPLPVLPRRDLSGAAALSAGEVAAAPEALRAHQPLHDLTHAVHAAGFAVAGRGIVLAREDVGRHNALDKLIGACLRADLDMGRGAVVLTSRVSVEMVQKTVLAGCPILVSVSAPTAHALRLAEAAGLTVAMAARAPTEGTRPGDARRAETGLETFTHVHRLGGSRTDAA